MFEAGSVPNVERGRLAARPEPSVRRERRAADTQIGQALLRAEALELAIRHSRQALRRAYPEFAGTHGRQAIDARSGQVLRHRAVMELDQAGVVRADPQI